MAKAELLLPAVIALVLAAAPATGKMPQDAAKGAAKAGAGESQAKAKKLYNMDCAMCHGDNGKGQSDLATSMELKLSDWTDAKSLADKQDQDLFTIIRNGKDKMPPEDSGRAKDEDVKALIVYIRSFGKAGAATTASN
jgi:cytochrome c5